MKKRVFSIAFLLILLLTLGSVTGSAVSENYCQHCQENVPWQPFTKSSTVGHFYVAEEKLTIPQLTFQWVSESDIGYDVRQRHFLIPAGRINGGSPYTSPNRSGNLYMTMEFYDQQTGVLRNPGLTDQEFITLIGNQCTYGPFWAWTRVINSTSAQWNQHMGLEKYGYLPLGGFSTTGIEEWDDEVDTQTIATQMGCQAVFEGYAQLQMADCLFSTGHMRMAATSEQLGSATVKANYSISHVTVSVTDTEGKEVYRENAFAPRINTLEMPIADAVDKEKLTALTGHHITVTCRIGTGENVVLFSGTIQQLAKGCLIKALVFNSHFFA